MAVKVRLMRIGAKSRPFYRIVAVDERRKRTGGYLELLGTYNPLTTPKEIKLDKEKLAQWKKKGAILSDGFLRIIGEAKQRNPRKTKKEKAAPKAVEATPVDTEAPAVEEDVVASNDVSNEVAVEPDTVEAPSEETAVENASDEVPVEEKS